PPPSFDPDTGLFYVGTMQPVSLFYLTDVDPRPQGWAAAERNIWNFGSELKAIDYSTGRVAWSRPLALRASGTSGGPMGLLSTPGPRLYVTNERAGELSIIDPGSRRVLATVRLGKRPRGIRVSPDGTTLYVALSGSPLAPPGADEKSLPPPDRSADGIGVVDARALELVRVMAVG